MGQPHATEGRGVERFPPAIPIGAPTHRICFTSSLKFTQERSLDHGRRYFTVESPCALLIASVVVTRLDPSTWRRSHTRSDRPPKGRLIKGLTTSKDSLDWCVFTRSRGELWHRADAGCSMSTFERKPPRWMY